MDVFGMLKSHSIYLNIAYGSKMSMFLFATGPLCVVVGGAAVCPASFFQLDHLDQDRMTEFPGDPMYKRIISRDINQLFTGLV